MDESKQTGSRMAAEGSGSASMACGAVHRQTPKAGARCVNSARRDLCGGYLVTGIPTATLLRDSDHATSIRNRGSLPGGDSYRAQWPAHYHYRALSAGTGKGELALVATAGKSVDRALRDDVPGCFNAGG